MENDKIHDYTDAYLESYLRALDKTHIIQIWPFRQRWASLWF